MIDVKVLSEHGYEESAYGFSFSYDSTLARAKELLPSKAHMQGGHNKFLESIFAWVEVRAPRYWWAQADTYRISTKQSQSTMHTILKREITPDDFAPDAEGEMDREFDEFYLAKINAAIKAKKFAWVKRKLLESFYQRRVWVMSYKTIQNVYGQRYAHRLPEWQVFLDSLLAQLQHPEFVVKPLPMDPRVAPR